MTTWGIEGFSLRDASATWGARARVTKAGWRFNESEISSSGDCAALMERLGDGALVRAEELALAGARDKLYPNDAIVCMVDEGELVVCVHSTGREARVAAFLRDDPTPLPGAYYHGQEGYKRTIETSPWYEGFRRRPGYGLAVSDGESLSFSDEGPQLFVHEVARQALERRFASPVVLCVTDNRQSLVTYRHRGGRLYVRAHSMFLDAPRPVIKALVSYVLERDSGKHVMGDYVRANAHRVRAARITSPLRAQGHVHDLERLFEEIDAAYFDRRIGDEVCITWGRRVRGFVRGVKLGSYSAGEKLIRINPVLDGAWVPRYFVSYIVYHELLHHVVPPEPRGRRVLKHPPEFQRREKLFAEYDRALRWERDNSQKLLGAP